MGTGRWRGSTPQLVAAIDQGLSSLSNVLAVVLVARAADADAFGVFALVYSVLILVLGFTRAWLGTRLALSPSQEDALAAASRVTGALVVLSPVVLLLVLGVGAVIAGGMSGIVVIVAVAAPVVCLQDALRFGAVSAGRPGAALASDFVWTLALAAALWVNVKWPGTDRSALLAWLGAAVAALIVALVGFRVRPSIRGGALEVRRRHSMGESMAFGAVSGQAASLTVASVSSATLGSAAAGSLRGASTAVGPVNVLFAFVHLALTPHLVRRNRAGDLGYAGFVALGLVGVVALWGAVLLLLPANWGVAALGDTWAGARSLLPWTVAEYTALAVATAATLGMKVRGMAVPLVRQKALVSVVTLVGGCAAAIRGGDVVDVAMALAGAAALSAALGWLQLARSQSRWGER